MSVVRHKPWWIRAWQSETSTPSWAALKRRRLGILSQDHPCWVRTSVFVGRNYVCSHIFPISLWRRQIMIHTSASGCWGYVVRQTSLPAPQRAGFKLTKEKRNDVNPHLAKLVWSTDPTITMEAATIIQPPSLYQPTYLLLGKIVNCNLSVIHLIHLNHMKLVHIIMYIMHHILHVCIYYAHYMYIYIYVYTLHIAKIRIICVIFLFIYTYICPPSIPIITPGGKTHPGHRGGDDSLLSKVVWGVRGGYPLVI